MGREAGGSRAPRRLARPLTLIRNCGLLRKKTKSEDARLSAVSAGPLDVPNRHPEPLGGPLRAQDARAPLPKKFVKTGAGYGQNWVQMTRGSLSAGEPRKHPAPRPIQGSPERSKSAP